MTISDDIIRPLDPTHIRVQRTKFLAQQPANFALTLCFNHEITFWRLRDHLRRFHRRLDRELFGRRFNERPRSERSWFLALPENLSSNGHAHLLLRVDATRHGSLEALFASERAVIWRSQAPRGTSCLRRLTGPEIWASYSTKYFPVDGEWIDSDEFLSEASTH